VSLEALGWDADWDAVARAAGDDLVPARVAIEHRGAYEVTDGDGRLFWAELPGRTYFDARDKRELPAVGDWIVVEAADAARAGTGAAVIRTVLPRRSLLVRRAAGAKTAPQPIAANVDVGFVVTSANADVSPRRLERYLVLLADSAVRPVIVLSKGDLVDDPAPLVAAIAAAAPGVEVAVTSAARGDLASLRAQLGTGTGVLLGSSGVGKSSVLNLLIGREAMATRPIRADERGVHTTTRRELFALPGGGVLIDTPGMRELALWAEEDDADFTDVEAFAADCQFADCRHRDEPGCAVRAAAGDGRLDPGRLAAFHKLTAELADEQRRRDAAARAEERRRGRTGARRSRLRDKKRGDE